MKRSLAASTKKQYDREWQEFVLYCKVNKIIAETAPQTTLCDYVRVAFNRGKSRSTMLMFLSAVRHKQNKPRECYFHVRNIIMTSEIEVRCPVCRGNFIFQNIWKDLLHKKTYKTNEYRCAKCNIEFSMALKQETVPKIINPSNKIARYTNNTSQIWEEE